MLHKLDHNVMYGQLVMSKVALNTIEKVRLFKSFFTGLDNVYGTYDLDTGKVRQVKEPVTDQVLLNHLTGRQSYGVYLLVDDKIRALAVDFDQDDLFLPVNFLVIARDYGLPVYIERSKSKGFHVWMFFDGSVTASKARLVAKKILSDIGLPGTEIFPKQDRLDKNVSYGNFINAPLFGRLAVMDRTVFLDPDDPTMVCQDQWHFLNNVKRIRQEELDTVIERYGLNKTVQQDPIQNQDKPTVTNHDNFSFGLPPCSRTMLAAGVTVNQRISTFRLAVHLKKIGLPFDLAVIALKAWSRKNRPADGKEVITEVEIESQATYAYQKHYRSFGCGDSAINVYCDQRCPLYKVKS